MHNAWKSSVSKMHVSADGSSSSMYISVNLLGLDFFSCFALWDEWGKLEEKEMGEMTLAVK